MDITKSWNYYNANGRSLKGIVWMKKTNYPDIFSKEQYHVIVLDMDGTLYYQRSMQFFMCLEMGLYAIKHPLSLERLKIISAFRKIREREEYSGITCADCKEETVYNSLLEYQYAVTAGCMGVTARMVQEVIEEWMMERPLKYLWHVRDKKLCAWIEEWKKQGKKVVIFSDYPVEKKVQALGIEADALYSSHNLRIGRMKPATKGLEVIGKDLQVPLENILVVGDRMSKDGKMAEDAGCDYVILKKWKLSRCINY